MPFDHQEAYIGPFLVTMGKGRAGASQTFMFPIPPRYAVREALPAMLLLEGKARLAWSTGAQFDLDVGPGTSFLAGGQDRPTALEEQLTLTATEDCTYLSIETAGREQTVQTTVHGVVPGEALSVPRYALLALLPSKAAYLVNGLAADRAPRLIYAKTGPMTISASTAARCAVFTLVDPRPGDAR